MTPPLTGVWLGTRPYVAVYQLQCELVARRREQQIGDVVLLLEHAPTITLGRGAHPDNIRFSPETLAQRGIELCPTDRGGDVTIHAPGQLVAYPVIQLGVGQRDVRRYVNGLSDVMRRLVQSHGVDAGKIDDYIGLWADAESVANWRGEAGALEPVKIGAIGVRISRWITMHGFALNYFTDMSLFGSIVPCGISSLGVSSVEKLTGTRPALFEEAKRAHSLIAEQYGFAPGAFVDLSRGDLSSIWTHLPAALAGPTLESATPENPVQESSTASAPAP